MRDVVLSALFYEIGRFRKRIFSDDKHWLDHSLRTLRDNNLETIAQTITDSISSLETAAKYSLGNILPPPEEGKPILMECVFSRVSLGHKAEHAYYIPALLSENANYPLKVNQLQEAPIDRYRSLWDEFNRELGQFGGKLNPDGALVLLEKYCSFIPYSESLADIPLYQQSKMTAAIASCLAFKDRNSVRPFLLVGGDLSGVQKFIYTISSKGALKGLRGRSFFVELIAEHVIFELLQSLGLSNANILFNGGARFNLLLPNTLKAVELLERQRVKINEYLLSEHEAKLYCVLEWTGAQFTDFTGRNIPALYRKLGRNIINHKRQKYAGNLTELFKERKLNRPEPVLSDHSWPNKCPRCGKLHGSKFSLDFNGYQVHGCSHCLPADPQPGECHVCQQENYLIPLPYHEEELTEFSNAGDMPLACPFCSDLFHLGEHLFDAKYILRLAERPESSKAATRIADRWYVLQTSLDQALSAVDQAEAIWVINNLDIREYMSETATQPFSLAAYHPSHTVVSSKDLTFEWFSDNSVGAARLGILRLDVDNLGDIATGKGFTDDEKSLLRISTMSRALTLFFKFHINHLCRSSDAHISVLPHSVARDRNLVIIYSGGDDAFIVGSWNDVAEFAFDVHSAFIRYTGTNPDVHLSAGMIVRESHYPIYQFAEEAGTAEHEAKKNRHAGGEKDSYAPFFESCIFNNEGGRKALAWDAPSGNLSSRAMLDLATQLARELGDSDASNSFTLKSGGRALLYKLFNIVEARRRRGRLYLPALAYALSRTEVSPTLERILLDADTINYLHPALTWVDLLGRRKHTQGGD